MSSKSEVVRVVKSKIKEHYGKTLNQLKVDIMVSYHKNGYGCSDHFPSKHGYSIFYTDNDNFMQGEKNGGGKGFFVRINLVGMCRDIKLSK